MAGTPKYKVPRELSALLKPFAPPIRKLALGLRQIVLEEAAPCQESVYDLYALALSYGPNGKMREQICHIAVYPRHVNLGFNYGAFMADPEKILLGKGSQIRHIGIHSAEDLARPPIREYLRQAVEMAGLDEDTERVSGVVTLVKACAPKRKTMRRGSAK